MSSLTVSAWKGKQSRETSLIESVLRGAGLQHVDAYRYNSVSIRVRVVDLRFEGLRTEQRDALVEPLLELLPEELQAQILTLFTFAPADLALESRDYSSKLMNQEFEEPSPSML